MLVVELQSAGPGPSHPSLSLSPCYTIQLLSLLSLPAPRSPLPACLLSGQDRLGKAEAQAAAVAARAATHVMDISVSTGLCCAVSACFDVITKTDVWQRNSNVLFVGVRQRTNAVCRKRKMARPSKRMNAFTEKGKVNENV